MKVVPIIIIFFTSFIVYGQTSKSAIAIQLDSLKSELKLARNDSMRVNLLEQLTLSYARTNPDSAIHYGEQAFELVINNEYLRLSYHGLRTKDKSFNAKFETNVDASIGKIDLVPQDIGRVILNLINNAFYAVSEKKKSLDLSGFKNLTGLESLPAEQVGYEPTVIVTSKKLGNKVEISVKENGNGIPQKVLDKIFQPFFTTKPTGQGTGLGLSLSYDIVKTHGGELRPRKEKAASLLFNYLFN